MSISTSLVLSNGTLRDRFSSVEHLDISDHRSRGNIGSWDLTNVLLALRHTGALVRRLKGSSGVVYLPLAQGVPGFVRDSFLIHATALRGWRVAAHLRGSELRSHLYDRQGAVMRFWIRATLRRLDSVAVLGASMRPLFEGLVDPERIAVVPNGTTAPRAHAVEPEPDSVVFLSNLRRRKGLFEALEAAERVLEERPTVRFSFAGAWESDAVEQEARDRARSSGDRIRFLDVVTGEEKDRLLASAWVFLFPPVEPEGHPRVVLEALAAGVPTVTVARGAIPDTVADGETGYVLPDPDPALLAERMLAILSDKGLHDRMAQASRQRFQECFTQEKADLWLADWLTDVVNRP